MSLPPNKLSRVIINTDAKNEADDQYAIVQGLLTPSFELHGIIAAHFGSIKSRTSMQDSYDEVMKLLDLMALRGQVRVEKGAEGPIANEQTAADSPGARLIVEQGMKDDPRPLHIAFLGPLTDMASALLIEPQLAKRNIRVVWIGGGEWPVGGREYNLLNDIAAANVVYRSGIEIWQIPSPVYKMMAVGYAELHERVFDKGPLGKYLVEQLIDWNSRMVPGPIEHRSLGDSPAIGIMMYPDCGESSWVAAPQFTAAMNYLHEGKRGSVRLYRNVDQRYIQEDFFAKLSRFARGVREFAKFDG
jgi:purine nucleosidase